MSNCLDFTEEESLLQSMGQSTGAVVATGAVVDRPKCHCEVAGEGIEYSWDAVKMSITENNYHRRDARKTSE